MLPEESVRHIRDTFKAGRIPTNVRVYRFLERYRFVRRFAKFALGSNLLSSQGNFSYTTADDEIKRIQFDGKNLQFRAIYDPHYKHGYEVETGLLMAHLCSGQAPFWDVGANWGIFSLLTASLPEFQGSIVAFEPNFRTFQDLIQVIDQAGMSARISAQNIGVGAVRCEMAVSEADDFETGLSHLVNTGSGRKVQVTTLDEFEAQPPNLIKIDAEGMELDVLMGGTRLLKDSKPFIVFENFLDNVVPSNTFGPLEFLQRHRYSVFVPTLNFNHAGHSIAATYGSDYDSLFETDAAPSLKLVELQSQTRFLLARQLNLLAVAEDRVEEISALVARR